MKIALIVVLAVIALIIVLLLVPTYFSFEFLKDDKNKKVDVLVSYLFLKIKLNRPKKEGKKKEKKEKPKETPLPEKIKKGVRVFKTVEDDVAEILYYAASHAVNVKKIDFYINFGLDDAMYTGILTGSIYGVIYNIIALLDNHIGVENCSVDVRPEFDKMIFAVHSKCILRIKNVHIMIMIFKVLKMYFKIIKIK